MTELSVIMPMRNAAKTVQTQLEALAASVTDVEWELIVVDDASTDNSLSIVENAASDFPSPLRIVHNNSPRGIGGARNTGVLASCGSKLAFCDADDIVLPEWVDAAAKALEHADAVSGLCLELTEPLNENARATNPACTFRNAYGVSLGGGNCAIRREVYFAVGGYDESLGHFGHEDSEISIRLGQAGYVIQPAPNMRLFYRDFHDIRTQFRKTWVRSGTEVMLWKRHPDVYGHMLDLDLHKRQVAGFAAWHIQLRRQGQGMSLHDVAKDGVTRLARFRAYRRFERAAVPEPIYIGPDPLNHER